MESQAHHRTNGRRGISRVGCICCAYCLVLAMLPGCRSLRGYKIVSDAVANCRQLSRDGVSALELGHSDEACTLFAQAVESSPTDVDARRQLAEALWKEGRLVEAANQMEQAVRLDPGHAPTVIRSGEMLLATGNVQRAMQRAEQAVGLDSTQAGAWALRGRIHHRQGNAPEALADLLQALYYAPQDARVLLEVAEVQHQLGRPHRCLTTLHHLNELYPPGEEPQRSLWLEGLAYQAVNRPDDAATSLASAAQRGAPNADLLYALAEAERAAGRSDAAVSTIRQAIALDGGHKASHLLLAQLTAGGTAPTGGTIRR